MYMSIYIYFLHTKLHMYCTCIYVCVLITYMYMYGNKYTGIACPPCSYDSHSGGEREIQRTMLELLNQLDGFDSRGDVKV